MAKREKHDETVHHPTPHEETDLTPRRYHLQLVDGERTVTAASIEITHTGALLFCTHDGDVRQAYPPGQWKYVELETQDQ